MKSELTYFSNHGKHWENRLWKNIIQTFCFIIIVVYYYAHWVTPGSMNRLFNDFFRKNEGVIFRGVGDYLGVVGRHLGRKTVVKSTETRTTEVLNETISKPFHSLSGITIITSKALAAASDCLILP